MINTTKKISNVVRKYSIFAILVIMLIISSFLNENFFTVANLTNIMRQISVTTILAFGETMLIITGLIDLSSGAVLALAGVISVYVFKITGSLLLAFCIGVLVGVLCNIVFGQGSLLYIPIPIIFMILMLVLTWYILNHTRFGRSLYAIGGNAEAANASGIKVSNVKFICFVINGVLVGLAGVLFMSRVNAGLPNAAAGYEFEAMTATIIGGTSFSGGIGTATGTLAGAFIVGFLNNIMNLLGINSYLQQIIRGLIIALAVIMDTVAKNKRLSPKELAIKERATENQV